MKISLTDEQIDIVLRILKKYLSSLGIHRVIAFGSRVKFIDTQHSDLDLAIDAPNSIPLSVLESLREDFEQSMLPFEVDIIDLSRVTLIIKDNILKNHLTFWQPDATPKTSDEAQELKADSPAD